MNTETVMQCHAENCHDERPVDKNGYPRSLYCNKHQSHQCTHGHPTIKTATQHDPRVIGCKRAGKLWANHHEKLLVQFKEKLVSEGLKTPEWIDSRTTLKAANGHQQGQFMLRRTIRELGIDRLAERLCGAYVAARYSSHSYDLIKIPDSQYLLMTKWAFDKHWPPAYGRRGKRVSIDIGKMLYKITEDAVTELNGLIDTRLAGTEFESLEAFSRRVIQMELGKIKGTVPKMTNFKFKTRTEQGEEKLKRVAMMHRALRSNLESLRELEEVTPEKVRG